MRSYSLGANVTHSQMNSATFDPSHIPDLERFQSWRSEVCQKPEAQRKLEEWVFLNAAGVLLADKTGELLTLRHSEFGLSAQDVHELIGQFAATWDFDSQIMSESNGSTKFVAYRRERLQAVLDEAPYCVMCGKLNYSYPLQSETFMTELKDRWDFHGRLPHEIGVALGYPLDDVFGYMGLLPLPCKGVCGWRVFGCMKESQRRSCAFNNARCQALFLLTRAALRK